MRPTTTTTSSTTTVSTRVSMRRFSSIPIRRAGARVRVARVRASGGRVPEVRIAMRRARNPVVWIGGGFAATSRASMDRDAMT